MLPETTPRPAGPRERRRRRLARRWLSAGLAAAAAGVAVSALSPPDPPVRAVLVAARDLPAGAVLSAGDLERAQRPRPHVPDGALAPGAAEGAVLAGAVRRGEALTDARTTGAGLLSGQPPGTLATTVAVGDPAVLEGLRPGARVDVLARTEDPVTGLATGAERVATDVVVLAVPSAGGSGGLLGAQAPSAGSVLVAVDARTASDLTAAAGRTVVALRAP
ncbi:SAF domain-containing protein [Kineococcus sp. SYSU DK005]|uniref:SAF domain-containing protein n=1 Tax=Kineococcus sp. SYSU DK005 TaxID=3383126 RepID=UPI003D7E8ED5